MRPSLIGTQITSAVATSLSNQPVGTAVAWGICVGGIANSVLGFWTGVFVIYIIHRGVRSIITTLGPD